MPDIRDMHYDELLTDFAVAYEPQGYIADLVLPPVPAGKKSDKYPVWGKEAFQVPDQTWATKTEPVTVDYEVSDDEYYCIDRAEQHGIDDRERANADTPFQLERSGMELISEQMKLGREIRVATTALTAASYAAGHQKLLAGNTQWDSGNAASLPLTDIQTAITTVADAIGRPPNTIVMSRAVRDVLKNHATILARMVYTNPLFGIDQFLTTEFPELDRVIVGTAMYETANPGQASVLGHVWGDTVLVAYIDPGRDMRRRTLGKQFVWMDLRGYKVRDELKHTDWLRGADSRCEKLCAVDAGSLIVDALA